MLLVTLSMMIHGIVLYYIALYSLIRNEIEYMLTL